GDLPWRRWSATALVDHMSHDKKTQGGQLRFILARAIGAAFVAERVPIDDVMTVLRQAGADA
uniref:hypothetical protein n=1 Tax=Thiocapsa sp. TaxID=2024551 RepID=UPI0035936F7E